MSYPPTPGPLPEHRPPAEPAPPPYSSPYQQTGAYQQTGYQHGVYQHGVDQHGVDQPAPQPGQYPPLGGYPGAMSEVRYAELTVSRPAEVTAAFWVWVVGTVLWPGGSLLAAITQWGRTVGAGRGGELSARDAATFARLGVGAGVVALLLCAAAYLWVGLRMRAARRGSRSLFAASGALGLIIAGDAVLDDVRYGVGAGGLLAQVVDWARLLVILVAVVLVYLPRAGAHFAAYRT